MESEAPYHYEYVEEWLVVLEGDVMLRTPDGERALTRRRCVSRPGRRGPQDASGRGERVGISTRNPRDVAPSAG